MNIYNIAGALGSLFILFGFYRISVGRWTNKSFWYELDNALGAILLVIYQLYHHTYATLILNVVWFIVAFRGLTPFAERYVKYRTRK